MELGGPFQVLARQLWIKATDRRFPPTGAAITPTAVQAGSSDSGAEAANLTSRRGLRNRVHTVNPAHMWRSAKGETSCWIEFDLGEPQPVSTIAVWNYNDTWHTDRGVRTADISVWTEETGWRRVHSDLSLEQAEGSDNYDEPTYVKLDAVMARKIRFDARSNFGDPDHIGLSEVGFFRPRGPEAIDPWPADGDRGVTVCGLVLAWSPGEGTVARDVYFGTDPADLKLLGRIEDVQAGVPQLAGRTKYFWRIDEIRTDGSVAKGNNWNFTTGGLAAWWKLDESEGTTVADSSGHGHHGVIHGSPVWLPEGGRSGGALQFDGVKDYVDTGWTEDLPTWTLSVWVMSPDAPASTPCSGPAHREGNLQINWNHDWAPYRAAAAFRSQSPDAWQGAGFGELRGNQWYHLAATYDGQSLKSYKDGVLVTSNSAASGPPFPEHRSLTIAKNAANPNYFAGMVDNVCVFSYALSADQIRALYSGKLPTEIGRSLPPAEPRPVQPAAQATKPSPRDGANGAGMGDLELTWSPGSDARAHDVYVGTSLDDLKLLGRVERAGATLSGLKRDSRYYWRIDTVQADGSVVPGQVWSFATGGLAGWWKLDEGEGTTVSDSSGNDHHGVIHGSPVWLPEGGRVGGALQFDGVKDYVDTGWADHLPLWTVAAWVKSPEAPKGPVASGPVHREKNFQINWDHAESRCRGAAGLRARGRWHAAGFGELKADTWYHLAATYDGESLKAYRDGVLTMENTDPSGDADPEPAPLTFGRHATSTDAFFAGTIDEVCVFGYPLSAEDIKVLYSDGGPAAIVARAAPSEPRLLGPTVTVGAAPAAEGRPPARVQPVSAPSQGN